MKRKRISASALSFIWLFSFLSLNALAQDTRPTLTKHAPITEQLITMIEHNSELKGMLVHSIESAKKVNPDKLTNPAQTLEEYYAFVDWAATAMPWSILPNLPYRFQIDSSANN
ncbi:MAG: hypothetical protein ABFD62_04670 [Syntrophaceae bacterium]